MMHKEPLQPTDPHLVWGRRQDRLDYRFRERAAIVEHLISRWSMSDWTGVDVSGGGGRWLSTLAPRFRQFTHLDLSPEAVHIARTEHPDFPHVEYGLVDLLQPRKPGIDSPERTWDVVFCFDTLLYCGGFVETVLRNIHSFISPRGIAIIDLHMRFRSWISRQVKGRRYGGPQRAFSPKAAHGLIRQAGFVCLKTAYQYNEFPVPIHQLLIERGLTGWVPWPSTWIYLVLSKADRR